MRFENLTVQQQLKCLQRIHKRLNKHLFENKLKTIYIVINDYKGSYPEDEEIIHLGTFTNKYSLNKQEKAFIENFFTKKDLEYFMYVNSYNYGIPAIMLDENNFIEELKHCKTQSEQAYFICKILLHEMVHQYCYEHNMSLKHDNNFMALADSIGLHCEYIDDKPTFDDEMWLPYTETIAYTTKIY